MHMTMLADRAWIKRATLQGIPGSDRLVEPRLSLEGFRSVGVTVPS